MDRLRPALEEIIAAGRQQFQQPYKQISIPPGGLIILKPSPNSQILTSQAQPSPEPFGGVGPNTPQPMHEGTPDPGLEDSPMTPARPPSQAGSGSSTPFSPANMMSPTGSLRTDSRLEDILREASPQMSNNIDMDFNLNLMEGDMTRSPLAAPPPPPPPPPPDIQEQNQDLLVYLSPNCPALYCTG